MKIEENMSDDENKGEHTKTERTVKANSIECPKLHVNSDICYCDRAPGSSRSIATKPHLKASYCVETKSNKASRVAAAAVADIATNKSNEKTTRDSSSDDKLSPVARDFGARNKTTKSRDARTDDIFTISHESFSGLRGPKSKLEKSIFSCVSSPVSKTKPSTVIIEELPNDEAYEKLDVSSESKIETKKETNPIEEKSASIKKSYVNKNKELISLEKEDKTKMSSKLSQIQAADKCEKSKKKTIDSNEVRMEIKEKTKKERDMLLNKKSIIDKNKKLISPEKEGKTKANTSSKIITNECRKESKLQMDLQVRFNISEYSVMFCFMFKNSQVITVKQKTCCRSYN